MLGVFPVPDVILVSEASNRYTQLFLVEREYFGFNTLDSGIVQAVINSVVIKSLTN
jgi:flavin reductase (DIM6/NTAB) family NADH-FMN oxidoreductase RutF